MEHHYSLTTRMLVIFVCGLMLLAALVFAAGLLVGRDWGASEAIERAKAAERAPAVPPPAPAPAPAPTPAAPGTNSAAGAIRPAGDSPATPAAPTAPVIPAAPKAPAIPAPPKAPTLPKLPPFKSSSVTPESDGPSAEGGSGAAPAAPMKVSAQLTPKRASSGESKARGYVVYVAAYVSGARAEKLAEQLRGRNLAAQTSVVDKPGQKPLVSVWVGPFDAKAEAQAALPEIRAAGLEEAMIKAVQ